jgi:hypothetical protein
VVEAALATQPRNVEGETDDRRGTEREEIAALLEERAGYLIRELADRVDAVDRELERLGHQADQSRPKKRARAKSRAAG